MHSPRPAAGSLRVLQPGNRGCLARAALTPKDDRPAQTGREAPPARFTVLGLGMAVLLAAGCANPGQPRAPSLQLPAPATALQAERVGEEVLLTWNTPANTTDRQANRGPIRAVVCRGPVMAEAQQTCRPVASQRVQPGPSRAADRLPPALSTGPATQLLYRVQLFNSAGRAANPSQAVFAVAGAPPAAAGPIHLRATRRGVLVTWAQAADPSPMQLTRTLLTPPVPGAGRAAGGAKPAGGSADGRSAAVQLLRAPVEKPGATGAEATSGDPGGLLDPTARPEATYSYVAQRVRIVTLGSHTLELRGEPSPPAVLSFHDVFAPGAPQGLVSVPTDVPAGQPSIDLSWEPNLEADLAGYNVYRREGSAAFRRLNTNPVTAPAYRDTEVSPGHSYTYRVTAVDGNGNESPPGAEHTEALQP